MKKLFFSFYAILCYLIFFGTFLYMAGFVENPSNLPFGRELRDFYPVTLDSGTSVFPVIPALIIDLLLIALFGIQHSVMARQGFKKKWTRFIPRPIERSTYVLFTSTVLIILFLGWQPVKLTIWNLSGTIAGDLFFAVSMFGWVMLVVSTYLIDHFDLFGLRQVFRYVTGKKADYLPFKKPVLYKVVRHPIYLSFLIIFWFAPLMTLGHLVFSLGMTGYILIGIYHEEKDLVKFYGNTYRKYRMEVPKIIPFIGSAPKKERQPETAGSNG